ncbi:MAG TPA: hypothetical protein VFG83_13420 [Kofleriaceae bacterium]|nr:hypothetical protein [Kofleriaceae bacterium]
MLRSVGKAALVATLVAASACAPGVEEREIEGREDLGLTIYPAKIENGLSGAIDIEVPEGTQSTLIEVRGDEGLYYLSKMTTPSSTELIESGLFVTRAARELPGLVDWLYPNVPDRPVEAGTYTLILRAEDPDGGHVGGEDAKLWVYNKAASSASGCGLSLDFLVDRDAVAEGDLDLLVDGLVARTLWFYNQVGVTITDYQIQRVDLPGGGVDVSGQSWRTTLDSIDSVLDQARKEGSARAGSVHIVIVRSLGEGGPAGYSMGLPGPFGADLPNSAVIISSLAYVDSDGFVDLDGLSTTLAHEMGHHLGLYHTSEENGLLHDPIDDTPECDEAFGCSQEFKENIMTPGEGDKRWRFTPGQAEVIKRHPLCVAMDVAIPDKVCDATCTAPETCAIWEGQSTCLLACDPTAPECPGAALCTTDAVGTYVCTP